MNMPPAIKILTFSLFAAFFTQAVHSQNVSGYVYEKTTGGKQGAHTGVNVYRAGTTQGTVTDEKGRLRLTKSGNGNSLLNVR
jgi:hypothetical protein